MKNSGSGKSRYIRPQDSSYSNAANTAAVIFFTVISVLAVLPVALVFASSVSSEESIQVYGYRFIPRELSFDAFIYLFGSGAGLPRAVVNSLIITASGTLFGLMIMCPCAYAMSRKEFRYKKILTVFLLIPMLFSGGLVSSYMVNTQVLHLKNTYLALILPGMCSTWYLMIMRNYFRTGIPDSLIEAGKLEGLSPMHSLVSIALPICRPVIMTVAVFQIFSYWNSWYPALVYIDTNHSELYPLQYVLVNIERTVQSLTRDAAVISGMQNVNVPGMTIRMALVVVTVLPVIILFPFFQRFLNTGMTIGAVKE